MSSRENETKNEQMFSNMAMTFSLEGVTKDIQEILQKKMNYHIKALKEVNGIVNSISSSKDVKVRRMLLNDPKIINLLEVVLDDFKVISASTNVILQELMAKKEFLVDQPKENEKTV